MHIAIDTSTSRPLVAICEAEQILFDWNGPNGNFHGETLLEGIDEGLKIQKLALSQIEFIALGVGPGTFTGLRIGVIMAKFLADAQGKNIVPVSSLLAQLWSANLCTSIPDTGRIWSLTDAKRHEVYALTSIKSELANLTCVAGDQEKAIRPEELAEQLKPGDFLLGEGAENYHANWPDFVHLVAQEHRYLRARNVGLIGWLNYKKNLAMEPAHVEARYLKSGKF